MPPDDEGADAIEVTLDGLLKDRGLTLTELAARIDLTQANLSILKNGHAKAVRFTTLAALCRELGCQPGDLLRYRP
jgi:putative transcriptional regulator